MFLTRIASTVSGRSVREARRSYSADGRAIAEFSLACGNGSVEFPTMYVKVCVWEALAEEALSVMDRKGLNIEASGFLLVRQYEGKHGKSQLIELKDVRELKIFDRDGDLNQVLTGGKREIKGVK
jgi:single-stranded DNA-binding protein